MNYQHIDTARGIAILMVILVHTSHSIGVLQIIPSFIPEYGQMGVQLFFIASAFTLCLSAERRQTESRPLLFYAIRRYFRIAPVYYVGILGYWIITCITLLLKSGDFEVFSGSFIPKNILANLFLVHGFVPSANNSIVPGGWSIGTEVAFYCLFPVIFTVAKRVLKASIFRGIFLLLFSVTGVYFLNYLINLFFSESVSNNNFYYFNIVNQMPVFVSGIIYYLLWKGNKIKLKLYQSALFFLLFSTISVGVWNHTELEGKFVIIPVLSAVSFVFLMELCRCGKRLNHPLMMRIGQVSYSMYLIHFLFAGPLSRKLSGVVSPHLGTDVSLILIFCLNVALSFGFAMVSERLIERPSVNLGKLLIGNIGRMGVEKKPVS